VASARWESRELLEPISADQPCGESLEDTDLLASFDTYSVFGHSIPLEAPPEPGEKRIPKPPESPIWSELQGKALEALRKSKDLRLLAYLGSALLRTEGLAGFCETLAIADEWLNTYWDEVYPRIDEDAFLRRSALSCFTDPFAVIDRLRRVPLVESRQHGRFGLRDLDIASGQLPAGEGDRRASEAQINAAFAGMPDEDLRSLADAVANAVSAAKRIDATMNDKGGEDAAPDLTALLTPLTRIAKVLQAQVASRAGGDGTGDAAGGAGETGTGGVVAVGAIASRQDAVRALDAVAEYFRRNEPSSPVPLIVDRAKRLVSKSFLDVLEDLAPEALARAREAAGVRTDVEAEKAAQE
jgi:type VI secretion system protein ImpA